MSPFHTRLIDRPAILNGFTAGIVLYPYVYQALFSGVDNNLSALTLWLIIGNIV